MSILRKLLLRTPALSEPAVKRRRHRDISSRLDHLNLQHEHVRHNFRRSYEYCRLPIHICSKHFLNFQVYLRDSSGLRIAKGSHHVTQIRENLQNILIKIKLFLIFCEPRKKMEDEVLNKLAIQVGWHSYDGILSPGGSINNLYACMIARHRAMPCMSHLMSKDSFHENVFF